MKKIFIWILWILAGGVCAQTNGQIKQKILHIQELKRERRLAREHGHYFRVHQLTREINSEQKK